MKTPRLRKIFLWNKELDTPEGEVEKTSYRATTIQIHESKKRQEIFGLEAASNH
jgi:hypothetical protein